jgi:hypothetical protein
MSKYFILIINFSPLSHGVMDSLSYVEVGHLDYVNVDQL